MSEDIREEIARLIGENRSWKKLMDDGYISVGSNTDEEIADALMPLVARIQAEALREAAEKIETDPYTRGVFWDAEARTYVKPGQWLRARADRLEQG